MNDVIKIIIKLRYNHRIKRCNKEYYKKYKVTEINNKFINVQKTYTPTDGYWGNYNYRNISNERYGPYIFSLKQHSSVGNLSKNY